MVERGKGIRASAKRVVDAWNEMQDGDSDSTVELGRAVKQLQKSIKEREDAQRERRQRND